MENVRTALQKKMSGDGGGDDCLEPRSLEARNDRCHGRGHILITTRRSDLQLAHSIDLDVLDEATSILFLLRRTNRLALDVSLDQANEHEQQLAHELAHELGGLPLALEQAGAYMATTKKSLADYLSLYQMHHAKLLNRRKDVPHDYLEPVATTWDISFERVIQRNAAAEENIPHPPIGAGGDP